MVRMGDVWDRTVEFIGDHLGRIMPIALLAMLVPSSISGSVSELQQNAAPGVALAIGVATIGLSVVQLWGQLAIAALAVDPALGPRTTQVATARLLPLIGVYLLLGLFFLVLVVPFVVTLVVAGVPLDQMRSGAAAGLTAGGVWALLLCAVAFLVVALIVAARLAVLLPVVAMERRGVGSIMRSVRLTRGLTLRLIGVLILYIVVVGVAMLAAQAVFGSALRLIAGDGGDDLSIAAVITAIVVAAVTTTFAVLGTAFIGKLYALLVGRDGAGDHQAPAHA